MDYELFREEASYNRPRRRINYFGWTLTILSLTGIALGAWLSTFYIFGQPERPQSYRILKKLRKIEQTKRFELTAAPAGEFLDPKKIFDRYNGMGTAELAVTNAELIRNYIHNYQATRGLVPYVVGHYTIMDARELGPGDLVTSGMVALTTAVDNGQLVMEHIYPSDPQDIALMKETLSAGLEVKLERTHDISAILHAEKLPDGRLLITAMPLLYGTYTVTKGKGTFNLEPPFDLNLVAGWPFYKPFLFKQAEAHFAGFRQHSPGSGGVPVAGVTPAGPVQPQNELVRVEQAVAIATPTVAPPPPPPVKPTPLPKGAKVAKNQKKSPSPSPSPAPAAVAKASVAPPPAPPSPAASATPTAIAKAPPRALPVTPPPAPAQQTAVSPATPPPPAPATVESTGTALASTAGGGSWKTYEPGKMPVGRLIDSAEIKEIADRGLAGERIYLKGQFVVNFAEANRAVLRPKGGLAQSMLRLGAGSSTRIIVEYPGGHVPPAQGSIVNRDDERPLEITEIRRQDDGQLNVFAREIMQP